LSIKFKLQEIVELNDISHEKISLFLTIIENELKFENYNSLNKLQIENSTIDFNINYFATGRSNFMQLISKGKFWFFQEAGKTKLGYVFYIGGGFVHMSVLAGLMTTFALFSLKKPMTQVLFNCFEIYSLAFIALLILTFATQKMFFKRIVNNIKSSEK
jgi:hypothetical protein